MTAAVPSAQICDESLARRFWKAVLFTPVRVFAHFIGVMTLVTVCVKTAQDYAEVFFQADARIWIVTGNVISFSDWIVRYWFLLVVALIVVDAPMMFALQLLPARWRWTERLYFSGFLVVVLLAIAFIAMALSMELGSIIPPE